MWGKYAAFCAVLLLVVSTCVQTQPYISLAKPRRTPVLSEATKQQFQSLFDEGRRLLGTNKARQALKRFEDAVALAPTNSDAYANIGLCFLRLGQGEKAIAAFAESEKHNPAQAIALLKQGQLLDDLGRHEDAKAAFERLAVVEPDEPWSFYYLGLYAKTNASSNELSQSRAVQHFGRCGDLFKKKLQSRAAEQMSAQQRSHFTEIMGKCLIETQQFDKAFEAFDRSIADGNTFAHITKADALAQLDRMIEAANAYEAALVSRGPSLSLHVALGGVYFSIAKPFAVVDDDSPAAIRMKKLSQEEKDMYLQKAIEQFDAALQMDPTHGMSLWSKGKALLVLGQHDEAAKTFQKGADVKAWPNRWQHLPPNSIAAVPRFDPTIKSRPNWTGDPIVAAAVKILQDNFEVMLGELKSSLPDYNPELKRDASKSVWSNKNSADLVDRGNWMMLYMRRGHRRESGCTMMPKTCQIVEDLEQNGLLGVSRHSIDETIAAMGESHTVFFSGLRGDTHVTAHCGPHNRRMRILFPMIIPEGGYYSMRLTDEYLDYEPARPIVFDDSYEHEVWATAPPGSDEPRVILILDIVHPSLR